MFIIFNSFSVDWYIYQHNLTNENLNFVQGRGFFIVGDNGTALECYYPISQTRDPWWGRIYPPTSENLNGAERSYSGADGYFVGNNGTIVRRYDFKWYKIDSPTSENLNSVAIFPSSYNGFIVGANGTILYGGGETNPTWYKYETSPTTEKLYSVSVIDNPYKLAWAVGENGIIIYYENAVWSLYSNSPTTNDLYSVSVYIGNPNQALACGANGTILVWNGSSWMKVDSGTTENLYCIDWATDYDAFCVGANGTTLGSKDKGYHWIKEKCPVSVDLHGVGCHGSYVWACGDGGTILYRGKTLNIISTSFGMIKALYK